MIEHIYRVGWQLKYWTFRPFLVQVQVQLPKYPARLFDEALKVSFSTSLGVVVSVIKHHVNYPLLVWIVDWMIFEIFDYSGFVKFSHVNSVISFIATSELRRWQNDGIHCQDFIDSGNDNVINSIIEQSLIEIEYSDGCHFNQPIQHFGYRLRRPPIVAIQPRNIWLQIKLLFSVVQ